MDSNQTDSQPQDSSDAQTDEHDVPASGLSLRRTVTPAVWPSLMEWWLGGGI